MSPPADLRPIAAPVFVDDTGRRRVLTRRAGRVLVIGFATYIGLMVIGFASDPRVGPIHLPTFGLPSLGLMVPPAPPAGGEQSGSGAPEADVEVAGAAVPVGSTDSADTAGTAGRALPAVGNSSGSGTAPALLSSASGRAPLPELRSTPPSPATTTSAPTTTTTSYPGPGPKGPTTTTSSPTTSTTTPTPAADPGRGPVDDSGPATGPAAAKGPDGSGPPGQIRKTTTTTAG